MLEVIAFILEKGIRIALTFASGAILLERLDLQRLKKCLWWGLACSFLAGVLSACPLKFFKLREEFDAVWALLAIILCLAVFVFMRRPNAFKFKKSLIFNIAFLLSLQDFIEISLFSRSIFSAENNLNTELILKIVAGMLGGGIAIILGKIFARISRFLDKKRSLLLVFVVFISSMAHALIILASGLLVLGFLPATAKTVTIVAPLINYRQLTCYVLLFVLGAGLFIGRYKGENRQRSNLNPAEKRKIKAAHLIRNYWIRSGYLSLAIVIAIMIANYAWASRKITLSPSEKTVPQNGAVRIPVEAVSDGNLHRFSCATEDGVNIRFIIVEKRAGIFGIGFDACDICGPVGYYQRKKGQIVCLACDVMMNLDTIGLPGGCNPIPLAYRKENDFLSIKVSDIEKKKEVFRE
ncbi:MAG: Fe-S-containing protein [Candidatus Omnitrophota bacterium]|nr:Fe-S-containing protein [Candidatus Omnitrophota bacterium]